MLRTEFDSLEVMEQIEYINNKLNEGYTLTNICKSLGIGRSPIGKDQKGVVSLYFFRYIQIKKV